MYRTPSPSPFQGLQQAKQMKMSEYRPVWVWIVHSPSNLRWIWPHVRKHASMLVRSHQHDVALHDGCFLNFEYKEKRFFVSWSETKTYFRTSNCLLLLRSTQVKFEICSLNLPLQSSIMQFSFALFSTLLFASAAVATLSEIIQDGYQGQDVFDLPISIPTNSVVSSNVLPTQ